MRLGACLLVLLITAVRADWAPFVLPWDDSAPGVTDFSSMNSPIGHQSRVTVDAAGHFQAEGSRIRFLGMNLASDTPFAPTNKADAIAARLAKFGINCVRFHHIDAPWAVEGGVIRYSETSSRTLNLPQLERIHYLVARLAAHGIYTDINLLTAREFRSGDGIGEGVTQLDSKTQHVLAFFNDVALDRQKEFAALLLATPSRFTGKSLAQDPSVAFVEILNENGLLQKWYDGSLDRLGSPYSDDLKSRWNTWLASRYKDDANLKASWGPIDQPLGATLLRNGTFRSGSTPWRLEQRFGALATATQVLESDGSSALQIRVTRLGSAPWHVQFNQLNLPLVSNQVYTVSWSARANAPRRLETAVMMGHDPWGPLGLQDSVELTTEWQTFTRSFLATASDANARLNFGALGAELGDVWLANLRLQPGGQIGQLPRDATLAARTIPKIAHGSDGFAGSKEARHDWIRFLIHLENRYYDEMVGYLRTRIGYPGLVFGTIMANSPVAVQSRLDVIDAHAYWQHPVFPAGDWNPTNWSIGNVSMVNCTPAETTLAGLARQRIRGKPFTVTEYQHASPNSYGAEGPILLAAYGALQDWDGIWMFDYGWGNDASIGGEAQPMGRFRGYFDTAQHPVKMANLLLAAALFRRGDVQPAVREHTVPLSPQRELELLLSSGRAWSVFNSSQMGVPGAATMVSRLSVDYGSGAPDEPPPAALNPPHVSDTGQLRWFASADAGYMTLECPRTRGAVGFITGKTLSLGDITFQVASNRLGWATVGMTMVQGESFRDGCKALLVATGPCENTGQVWKTPTRDALASWGMSPTRIESVAMRLHLPSPAGRVRAWILDERGQRRAAARVEAGPGSGSTLVTESTDATLWYEIEVDGSR